MNIWTEAIMHNIPVDILYLDYQKAFDCVPHKRLIQQVRSFGITGPALNWIAAFLSGRKQKVRVNGSESSWAPVLSGIPQGSILGPILFSLFVNDIPGQVKSLISMFADDTKIYTALSADDSMFQLQEDLWILEDWANRMLMKFHPLKCKILHLGKNNPQSRYYMHKEDGTLHKLESVEVEKDLGVQTDKDLKFTNHCQSKINTATKMLMYIKHTFKYIDEDIFQLLYRSLVRPHLEFCSTVWSPHLKYLKDAVERVQRRATKVVPTLTDLSYTQRLQKLNLETLDYRRRRADLLELYRIKNNIHSIDQSCYCSLCPDKKMFPPSLSQSTRGHPMKIQVQHATGIRKHFFSTRVTPVWNNLTTKTINSKTINIFKNNLRHELPNKFSYNFSY
jgi:ribonuclease P/MRP protein subunit RPP40